MLSHLVLEARFSGFTFATRYEGNISYLAFFIGDKLFHEEKCASDKPFRVVFKTILFAKHVVYERRLSVKHFVFETRQYIQQSVFIGDKI